MKRGVIKMVTKVSNQGGCSSLVLNEPLTEASRKDLRSKSQRESPKRYAKRLNYYVSNFKGVNLAQLFENDYFIFSTPIKDYICTLAFPGVLTKLKEIVKSTNGDPKRINLRMVIQALREAFDATDNIKVRCTCPDFKYRFMHYAWRYDYLYGDPTPGTEAPPDITNPDNAIGATCKHLDLFLANKRWLTRAASTVNALIHTYPDKAALYLYDEEDQDSDEIVRGAFSSYDEQGEDIEEVETNEVEETSQEDTEEATEESEE